MRQRAEMMLGFVLSDLDDHRALSDYVGFLRQGAPALATLVAKLANGEFWSSLDDDVAEAGIPSELWHAHLRMCQPLPGKIQTQFGLKFVTSLIERNLANVWFALAREVLLHRELGMLNFAPEQAPDPVREVVCDAAELCRLHCPEVERWNAVWEAARVASEKTGPSPTLDALQAVGAIVSTGKSIAEGKRGNAGGASWAAIGWVITAHQDAAAGQAVGTDQTQVKCAVEVNVASALIELLIGLIKAT